MILFPRNSVIAFFRIIFHRFLPTRRGYKSPANSFQTNIGKVDRIIQDADANMPLQNQNNAFSFSDIMTGENALSSGSGLRAMIRETCDKKVGFEPSHAPQKVEKSGDFGGARTDMQKT